MKKFVLLLRIAIIFILMFSGCSGSNHNDRTSSITDDTPTREFSTEFQQVFSTAIIEPAAQETRTPKQTTVEIIPTIEKVRNQYEFEIYIDYPSHHLQVQQTITYKNQTGRELIQISLLVPPSHYENVIQVTNYSSNPASTLKFPENGQQVGQIELTKPLADGSTLSIYIDFTIDLPSREGPFGYTQRQMNLVNWYPIIPPNVSKKGWVINEFSPIGEYIVTGKSDYYAKILLNDMDDLEVACSGENKDTDNEIVCSIINAREFSLSISPYFQRTTENLGNLTINAYTFTEDVKTAPELIRNTASALLYYEMLYDSKYPRSTLNIIEADFPDGMESDGMYFLSRDYIRAYDGTHRNYMTILSAHETAHQWFYGMVGNDPAREPWLDEAFCTLSEIMFFEEFYPADTEWWWGYRVNSYNPQGSVNSTIYEMDSLRSYINAVYLQGVRFLSELRNTTGDEYFLEALRNYVHKYSDQIATSEDFFSEFAPFDISGLKEKYFFE